MDRISLIGRISFIEGKYKNSAFKTYILSPTGTTNVYQDPLFPFILPLNHDLPNIYC